MKKSSHPIDDFFREALTDHEVTPSPEARSAFLSEASRDVASKRSRRIWWILLGGILLLTGVSVAYFLSAEKKSTSPVPSSPTTVVAPSVTRSGPTPNNENELNINDPKLIIQSANSANQPSPAKGNANLRIPASTLTMAPEPGANEITSIQPAPAKPAADEAGMPPVPEGASSTPGSVPAGIPAVKDLVAAAKQPVSDTGTQDSILHAPPAPPKKEPGQGATSRPWSLDLGASYTAEWMFNTLEGRKYVNNFGLEVAFKFDRYSVRTGAGLSLTEGTNEWLVEYNDYLGAYNKLDSMDFNWDNNHYHLLPTYYMSQQNVWDSLVKTEYPSIVKRYTYLQIPLILGYDVIRSGRFAAGFRAGPILSILLSSKQLTAGYDPGKNNVLLINQISPDRVQMNWQVMGGINASFSVTRKLSFELEPEARYYFNSVYEKSDITKKPWSVGIRAAFLFKF